MLPNRLLSRTKAKWRLQVKLITSRKNFINFLTFFALLLVFVWSVTFITYKFIQQNNDPLAITRNFIYLEPLNSYYRQRHVLSKKIDYHDYKYLEREQQQLGLPGENGTSVYCLPEENEKNDEIFKENAYAGFLSDKIALNRSLPDLRDPHCKTFKYAEDLPTVSVVIPFFNDHLSVLLRTVHSVINRAPKHLLKEVILVNDNSKKKFLYKDLEDHLKSQEKLSIVKLIVLPRRSGLIWARLAGARAATGDVLLFLDSHTEACTNYLPPLLEPIANDYRTCVCPLIDIIDDKTFAYVHQGDGHRGMMDWFMNYERMSLRPIDKLNPGQNFESPIMQGGLFAISTKFFWELGGYDTGLDIWGGEQFEISFKIWLCGGRMIDTPCSRFGHVYREFSPFSSERNGTDFMSVNIKRVAEVWMDEFKEYLYKRKPKRFAKTDAGDLSYQFYIKKRQNCKPFSYFLEHVAPDMLERFPYIERGDFASGAIQSVASPKFCIDQLDSSKKPIGLYWCHESISEPEESQYFRLRYTRDIASQSVHCMDSHGEKPMDIVMYSCHYSQGNQYFRYDLKTKQIFHGRFKNGNCIEADIKERKVFVTNCDASKATQQWNWGFVNETNVKQWLTYGSKFEDSGEIEDLENYFEEVF